jgi:hypothetical protein
MADNAQFSGVSGQLNPSKPGLIDYFRSGWAFLIPYLAAYLLYAWRKWPVNPEGAVKVNGESTGARALSSFLQHLSLSLT